MFFNKKKDIDIGNKSIRFIELHEGDEFIVNDKGLYDIIDVQAQMGAINPIKLKLIDIYGFMWFIPSTWKYLNQRYYKFLVVANGGYK